MARKFLRQNRNVVWLILSVALAIASVLTWANWSVSLDSAKWRGVTQRHDYMLRRKMSESVIEYVEKQQPLVKDLQEKLGPPDWQIGADLYYSLGMDLFPPNVGDFNLKIQTKDGRATFAAVVPT